MKLKDLKFLKIAIEKHPTNGMQLEYLDKVNAIAAMILNTSGTKTLLVKQYRPGFHGELFEIPAGLMENGEGSLETLYREMEEETGYTKADYNIIYKPSKPFIVTPGCSTESIYMYILQLKDDSIVPKNLKLDEGEELEDHWVDLDQIEALTSDLKTIFTLYLYKAIKEKVSK